MMTPEERDFQDIMVAFFARWHPDLMSRITLADTTWLWARVEAILDEAQEREPIHRG